MLLCVKGTGDSSFLCMIITCEASIKGHGYTRCYGSFINHRESIHAKVKLINNLLLSLEEMYGSLRQLR